MSKTIFLGLFGIIGAVGLFLMTNSSSQNKQTESLNTTPENQIPTTEPSESSLSPSPSLGPTEQTKTNEQIKSQSAVIKTSKGDITVELYRNNAPKTVENFVKKAQSGFYNNLTFHRVEDWVVQGGDPLGNGTGGGKMATELNDKPFVVGSVGVARGGDIKLSNDSQFFITTQDASWLNNQYTNFGMVIEGMDVVNKIGVGDKIFEIITN